MIEKHSRAKKNKKKILLRKKVSGQVQIIILNDKIQ